MLSAHSHSAQLLLAHSHSAQLLLAHSHSAQLLLAQSLSAHCKKTTMEKIKTHRELKVYQSAFKAAMTIFDLS